MREYISGRRWFWAVTLFACAYPILAALIGAALRLLSCFILAMSSRTRQDARTRPCRIG